MSTPCVLSLLACVVGCSSELSRPDDRAETTGASADGMGVVFGDDGSELPSDGSASDYFAGQACAGQTSGAESLPAVLGLLVDTSGSMDEDAPGARGSKWTVTRRAVLDAVEDLPPETALGVTFYPNVPANSDPCFDRATAVAIDTLDVGGSQQRRAIDQAFQRQAPQGGTPTHDAYQYAVSEVAAAPAGGPRFIVLITDGVPTYSIGCEGTGRQQDPVDPTPLIGEAAAALARGIRTFVIGSPGSEDARESLSRMAEAGGTAAAGCSHSGPNSCHFDMTRERDLAAGLGAALEAISGQALSCQYEVPLAPPGEILDSEKVNVLFTPPGGQQELIVQSLDADCREGWRYSEDVSQIRLCINTCERVQSVEGIVSLQFGCATQVR